MKKDMTKGKEWKLILLFTLPIVAGNLLQQLYNTADNIIVGRFVSETAFSAVSVTAAPAFLFLAFSMGIAVGVGVVISQLFGARDYKRLAVAIDTSVILLGIMGIAVMIIGWIITPWLLGTVLSVPDTLLDFAIPYMRAYCVGMPFQFVYNGIAAILRGVGDSKSSLYFLFITAVLNIFLDIAAIYIVSDPIAQTAGTAWATVVSQVVCVIISFRYMRRRLDFGKAEKHFDGGVCGTILKIGLPTAIQQSIVSLGSLAMQRLVNGFADDALIAAYGAGNRLNSFAFVPIIGFQSGLANFAGQNMGANRLDRVKKGYHATLIMGLAATVLICVTLYVFATPLVALFGLVGDSVLIGVEQIRFLALWYWFFSMYMLLGGVLQGAGDTVLQSAATLTALVIRVVVGYIGVHFGFLGYAAAWNTMPMGWAAAAVITQIRYFTGGWKKKAIASRGPEDENELEQPDVAPALAEVSASEEPLE